MQKIKPKNLKGRVKLIDRFNKCPEDSNFYNDFQEIMIQRLNLNYIDKYHKSNINKIVRSITTNNISCKITGGFLLSCHIEPELYLKIQDTAKRITGNHVPMNELIYFLLSYFCHTYQNDLPNNQLPYKHLLKGKRFSRLQKFQNRFGRFYGNIVRNFAE